MTVARPDAHLELRGALEADAASTSTAAQPSFAGRKE